MPKGNTFLFRATSQEREGERKGPRPPESNDKRHRPHHCAGLDPEVFAPIPKLRVGLALPRSIAAFYTHDTAGRPLLDNCAEANAENHTALGFSHICPRIMGIMNWKILAEGDGRTNYCAYRIIQRPAQILQSHWSGDSTHRGRYGVGRVYALLKEEQKRYLTPYPLDPSHWMGGGRPVNTVLNSY